MVNPSPDFDAGVFLSLVVFGFIFLLSFRKTGGISLIVSTFCFLVCGLMLLTGASVSSFTQTTEGTATPINQTTYFIGNGNQPTDLSPMIIGYVFVVLAIVSALICMDSLLRGNFFPTMSN